MGTERLAILAIENLPKAEVAALKLLEETGFVQAAKVAGKETASGPLMSDTAGVVESQLSTGGDDSIRYVVFGRQNRFTPEEMRAKNYPQTGPVWNEEVLYRRDAMSEHASELMFGEVGAVEKASNAANSEWLKSAGFKYELFTSNLVSKKIDTGMALPERLLEQIQRTAAKVGQSADGSIVPQSTHYFRDANQQIRMMDAYPTSDAATLLGLSRRRVQELVHGGSLVGHKVEGLHGLEWRVLLPAVR